MEKAELVHIGTDSFRNIFAFPVIRASASILLHELQIAVSMDFHKTSPLIREIMPM